MGLLGSRSLTEPTSNRSINSIISTQFPSMKFASDPKTIPVVLPQRTFLEKIFLLHEEFSQKSEKIRNYRLSRHLYDLVKLMDTDHGITAIQNRPLYNTIVSHRQKFNAIKNIDYKNHSPEKIKIIPPASVLKEYEKDYTEMNRFMIYGESIPFEVLIKKIEELQNRINLM